MRRHLFCFVLVVTVLSTIPAVYAAQITTAGQPAQLDIRAAGEHSIRITLKPIAFKGEFPFSPALAERKYADPAISLRNIEEPVKKQVGSLNVEVRPSPLRITAIRFDAPALPGRYQIRASHRTNYGWVTRIGAGTFTLTRRAAHAAAASNVSSR